MMTGNVEERWRKLKEEKKKNTKQVFGSSRSVEAHYKSKEWPAR